ncbi:MAG: multidrug efflux SMR transporter [Pseudomonadota bacterium]
MGPWLFLSGAIALEIAGTVFLKLSDGFSKWQWAGASILCYWICFAALAPALRDLPVGVVYAIWAGAGILGGVVIGIAVFGETLNSLQYICIGLILIGAVGLRLSTHS